MSLTVTSNGSGKGRIRGATPRLYTIQSLPQCGSKCSSLLLRREVSAANGIIRILSIIIISSQSVCAQAETLVA